MSALPANSPIQRLDFDILWCIVKINADSMFEDNRALETTLASSRVCHDWRNFMLNTTSIWAHLVDLDHLLWRTVKGRNELMRRSGTAMLWVKIHDTYNFNFHSCCAPHILDVVRENWERIQKLEVVPHWKHAEEWWPLLSIPAPYLESFAINFKQEYVMFNVVLESLFGGCAPMLRELRFSSGYKSIFTPRPWMRQLHSLDLTVELRVAETLAVLMFAKNLVNLRLDRTVAGRSEPTLPLISLPKLVHLELNPLSTLELGAVASLLQHLLIPPACSLSISARRIQREGMGTHNTFRLIIQSISTSAQHHFTYHVHRQIDLTITSGLFIFTTATCSEEPTFRFSMEMASEQMFPDYVLRILLHAFSLSRFSEVTSFRITIRGTTYPAPEFTTFIACLPSVNVLTTDEQSLSHLLALSALRRLYSNPHIEFPALKILELSYLPSRMKRSKGHSTTDHISKFVMARIAQGHAISVIDFTCDTMDVLPKVAFLGKADGLKVRWRQRGIAEIREYVCGIGEPQTLASV
ncbi:hypothetical protein HYPSUDRAFT_204612 [Hypholoma sublateritium FD-334 SS-4]|uniref:F-box domain-containing protein n=1 Tax=Hypholoma sublateritium (strain FD-334 SS-4) TaxID=945553 RepID=A0A0D2PH16_HYPSF|nr:hypothetical protein HYPSUDRAFT_204612 [Hypholoma sublateritium FD-334 SS-4]